ncbi:hypothetical protein [Bacteriovorax sp. DB6_IX]|uniref:hypothetical protein n=1 Tax=Bacteriovorax sp. DB6_IX TaxID=1353530 RepID=UPI000389F1A1|nr:hypothetical protein [Bacteriovorax sp. DB6_IX]EQC52264.1 hypothetical protein M901_1462 [Bacteriovorax sp. DB6_IX]
MKKAFLIGLSLLSLNSHALLERAFFPELTGQITEIQSDKGIKLEDLRVEYVVACSGHKTDSLFGYDNGLQLTNCADDTISYDIQVYEDGTFDLPRLK